MFAVVSFIALCTIFLCVQYVASEELDCDPFLLHNESLSNDPKFRASIANGQLGAIVYHPFFHINGFYNGARFNSTYARVPNPIAFWIDYLDPFVNRSYTLDMYSGVFIEHIHGPHINITTRLYAHQLLKSVMVAEVEVSKSDDFAATLYLSPIGINDTRLSDIVILKQDTFEDYSFLQITSVLTEVDYIPPPVISMISTTLPRLLKLDANITDFRQTFLFAISVNNDENVRSTFQHALDLAANGSLFRLHTEAWRDLWEEGGRIDIDGNCTFAQTVHATIYYLTSSLPMDGTKTKPETRWPFFGITPASLAQVERENYHGHVFWDQDTWMLPGIQVFYPDVIKRVLIDSRFRNLDAAKEKAKTFGLDGAMFPWELAYSGYDTSPWPPSYEREIHITGDVALAMKQYLYYTKDASFVIEHDGYTTFCEIAKFWKSRLTYMADTDTYGIFDGMGPDEDHDHVNNSAYLNVIAQMSLRIPDEVYSDYIRGTEQEPNIPPPDPQWLNIANKVDVPFDKTVQYHPEFDGFNYSTDIIKQADVVLLGYPLMLNMTPAVRKNDLDIYEPITRDTGPAMTWAMHAIGWLELDEFDHAAELFKRNFDYIHEPYMIWSENINTNPSAGAINFVTGMGGFLQSILNGYFGIRVYHDRFDFKPVPLPNTTSYTIKNIKYLDNIFDATVSSQSFSLNVVKVDKTATCQLKNYASNSLTNFQSYSSLPLGKYSVLCGAKTSDSYNLKSSNIVININLFFLIILYGFFRA